MGYLLTDPPDFEDSIILRKNATIEHVCHAIHRSIVGNFKYALVWVSVCLKYCFRDDLMMDGLFQGTSTKYSPQRVGIAHVVHDEDVVQIVKKG